MMGGEPSGRTTWDAGLDRVILEQVSQGTLRIPPYPAVALRVQETVSRDDFGLAEVARLVASDAALATDVLRCANSPLYRRGSAVTDLTRAITRVGAKEVKRLALTSGLAPHAYAPGPLAALKRLIWIESLASAVLCQELARLRALSQEEAYVLGLLHDFGKLVACSCIESILGKGGAPAPRPLAAWAEVVERHHTVLGVQVAERWRLPPLVRDVVSSHHQCGAAGCNGSGLLDVVKASDQILGRLGTNLDLDKADLRSIQALAPAERDALGRILEKIPGFIAAFETPEPRPDACQSLVVAPAGALGPGERAVSFEVMISMARRARRYTATAIGPDRLAMVGKEALPESRLLEARLECPEPFPVWVLTRSSRVEAAIVHVEVQPYALSGEVRSAWNHLIAP